MPFSYDDLRRRLEQPEPEQQATLFDKLAALNGCLNDEDMADAAGGRWGRSWRSRCHLARCTGCRTACAEIREALRADAAPGWWPRLQAQGGDLMHGLTVWLALPQHLAVAVVVSVAIGSMIAFIPHGSGPRQPAIAMRADMEKQEHLTAASTPTPPNSEPVAPPVPAAQNDPGIAAAAPVPQPRIAPLEPPASPPPTLATRPNDERPKKSALPPAIPSAPIFNAESAPAVSKDAPDATTATAFLARQSGVTTLLVAIDGRTRLGMQMRLSATVEAGIAGTPTDIETGTETADGFRATLKKVTKYLASRPRGLPAGHRVTLAFSENRRSKDGPSATLAAALLVESLLTGRPIDPAIAVTGDLDADGRIGAVGGIIEKLRAVPPTAKPGVLPLRTVILPASCERDVWDTVLLDGPSMLWQVQILAPGTFEQAWNIAAGDKQPEAQATADFAKVQNALRQPGDPLLKLRSAPFTNALASVVRAMPQHLSASLLLAYIGETSPKTLSLPGSVTFLAVHSDMLLAAADDARGAAVSADEITRAQKSLTALRAHVAEPARPLADALLVLADGLKLQRSKPLVSARPLTARNAQAQAKQVSDSVDLVVRTLQQLSRVPEIQTLMAVGQAENPIPARAAARLAARMDPRKAAALGTAGFVKPRPLFGDPDPVIVANPVELEFVTGSGSPKGSPLIGVAALGPASDRVFIHNVETIQPGRYKASLNLGNGKESGEFHYDIIVFVADEQTGQLALLGAQDATPATIQPGDQLVFDEERIQWISARGAAPTTVRFADGVRSMLLRVATRHVPR